ncbi:HNHc domain containing protein [uncultured Caudovirales phage]|uniref:HNHc domain containing protein n=1 Tax=uncultured Caudovirales phage TaxID=2100421 RepID=A0A6J5NSB3_9CAUD|nr:HNHc domain containing protein [uncultured Caudovirales phage]CAB4189682.1 HNHc domain containing protein [uncultured Caudovirales phage]
MVMGLKSDIRVTRRFKALRLVILARDGYTCAYCGGDANTVDHVVSIKVNPQLAMDESNLVACCTPCNSRKGAKGFFSASLATPYALPASPSLTRALIDPQSPFEGLNKSNESA